MAIGNYKDQFKEKDARLFVEVEKLIKGDSTCYNNVYELSEKYIYKIIYDIVKNHYTTEDLMQDTYLKIYNNISQLKDPKAFYSWAGRIATNCTFRYLEKNSRELLSIENEDEDSNFIFNRASDDKEDFIPETVLLDKEKQRLIAEIIDKLSIEQKISVQYFYYEELSVKEIAKEMNCSEGTVKSRLNYARKSIKDAVIDLDVKHNTRLYSLATLPLVWIVFRQGVDTFVIAGATAGAVASAGVVGQAAVGSGAAASGTGVGAAAGGVASSAGVAVSGTGAAVATATGATTTGAGIATVITGASATVKIAAMGVVVLASGVGAKVENTGVFQYTAPSATVVEQYEPGYEEAMAQKDDIVIEYGDLVDNYENMGVSQEELIRQLANASEQKKEVYTELNEYFALYNDMKRAYQACLSSEQYAVVNQEFFSVLDETVAMYTDTVNEFLNFASQYEEYTEVQRLYDMEKTMMDTINNVMNASITLLNHRLSADIMSKYSVEDIRDYMEEGFDVPYMIQVYLQNENTDGTYNDLVDTSNNLGEYSQQCLDEAAACTQYMLSNDILIELNNEYMENLSMDSSQYDQELQNFTDTLLQDSNDMLLQDTNNMLFEMQ